MWFIQVQIKHFIRGRSEHEGNIHNSLLGLYFALSGFLNLNKDGNAHFKKNFSSNEDNRQNFKGALVLGLLLTSLKVFLLGG